MIFLIAITLISVIAYIIYLKKNHTKELSVKDEHYKIELDELSNKEINKTKFLATMAHEIRTPLNGVIVAANILNESNLSGKDNELVNIIKNSGELLINVINDILDFSKIEAGKMSLDYQSFKLNELLNEVIFFFEPQFKQKGLFLHYKIDETMVEDTYSDPNRIKQILYNIIGNSYKFTEQGGVSIRISKREKLLTIEIQDTGIGIKKTDLENLFDTYTQVKGQSSEFGGTGLGLNISKCLSNLLGGDLDVVSTYGKGSIFTITLKDEALLISSQSTNKSRDKKTERTIEEFKNLKVLLVDDNEVNRKVATLILKRKKIVPDTAENGKIAVEMALAKKYDIIFMDISMPIMNGYEASEKLIELIPYQELPLIYALSANAFKEDKDLCFNAGMNGFIAKPISFDELDETLIKVIERKNDLKNG